MTDVRGRLVGLWRRLVGRESEPERSSAAFGSAVTIEVVEDE